MDKELLNLDPNEIDFNDELLIKKLFIKLLNGYGEIVQENKTLKEENQKLKDEINKLKGEKGKPKIKAKIEKLVDDKHKDTSNFRNKPRKRDSKIPDINIDNEVTLEFSKEELKNLPKDVKFKGYREKIVQDIKIETNNTKIKIPLFYSKQTGKSYEPNLPKEYDQGEFGPTIKAFVMMIYFLGRVPKNKIKMIVQEIGCHISKTKINDIINKDKKDKLREYYDEIGLGLTLLSFFNIDSTGFRDQGKNNYLNVLCNPICSYFRVLENKKRETIKELVSFLNLHDLCNRKS